MYESGYGCIINTAHVIFLEEMAPKEKLDYIKELWQEDSRKYLEWKSECVLLDELSDCFGDITNNYYEQFITDKGAKIINYLQNNGGSFEIVSKESATHVLEQLFNDDNQLISQEIKEL